MDPGAILVDVDSEEALQAIGGADQGTLSCKTPRGWQFLFSGNERLSQTQGQWRIDIRSPLKGYGIAPGSRTDRGAYKEGQEPAGDAPWTYEPLHVVPVIPIPASLVEAINLERALKGKGATNGHAPLHFDVDTAAKAIETAAPGERHQVAASATMSVLWKDQSQGTYERLRDTFVKSTGGESDRGKEYDRMWEGGKRKVEKSKNDNATWLRGESDRMEVVPKLLPIAEGVRVLLKHVKLDLRLNERSSREEIRGEHSGWVPLASYRALLHNRLENIWFPVEGESGDTTYKPRSFAKVNLNRAILGLAQENPQDPFRDYLLSLPVPTDPEKVEKLAMQFLTAVLGVAPGYDTLAAVGFRNLFRGIVWRTLVPCNSDFTTET